MFRNVVISNDISLVLRDSDMDSENFSLIWHSVSDGQKNVQFKGRITDRYKISFSCIKEYSLGIFPIILTLQPILSQTTNISK